MLTIYIFRFYVNKYNSTLNEEDKIALNVGFLNTKKGTIIMYSQIGILLFGFIFHLIMHPQSSIFTLLVGFSLTIQLFVKRKDDKKMYEYISKLS
jgi:hypothetical protein